MFTTWATTFFWRWPEPAALALAGLTTVAMACSRHSTSHGEVVPAAFGQAQSFLEEFSGAPLLSANWTGPFRPYVWKDGRFAPLLTPRLDAEFADADFYRPTPLSDHEIVLGAQLRGRREFEIFLLDTALGTLTNLTDTPAADEGNYCVDPKTRRIAFAAGDVEHFGTIGTRLSVEALGSAPAFEQCIFDRDESIWGAVRAGDSAVYRCDRDAGCVRRDFDAHLVRVLSVFATGGDTNGDGRVRGAGSVGFIASTEGASFRKAFLIENDRAVAVPIDAAGDVLDYDGTAARIGRDARYWSSLAPDSSPIVSKQKRIGAAYYGIVANDRTARTLGELVGGRWSIHTHPASPETSSSVAEEVWLTSRDGQHHQAFLFPAHTSERAILWLHGGPLENVSPRYNAYFARLNELGFSVLALNYPGSTGRGSEYESRFQEAFLVPALEAALDYLKERGAVVRVSWSVSTGAKLQRLLAMHRVPLSAMVDQAGFDNRDLLHLVRGKVPYFSIRGAFDDVAGASDFDFVYPGGHDITRADQFESMLRAAQPFLEALGAAKPWP